MATTYAAETVLRYPISLCGSTIAEAEIVLVTSVLLKYDDEKSSK